MVRFQGQQHQKCRKRYDDNNDDDDDDGGGGGGGNIDDQDGEDGVVQLVERRTRGPKT